MTLDFNRIVAKATSGKWELDNDNPFDWNNWVESIFDSEDDEVHHIPNSKEFLAYPEELYPLASLEVDICVGEYNVEIRYFFIANELPYTPTLVGLAFSNTVEDITLDEFRQHWMRFLSVAFRNIERTIGVTVKSPSLKKCIPHGGGYEWEMENGDRLTSVAAIHRVRENVLAYGDYDFAAWETFAKFPTLEEARNFVSDTATKTKGDILPCQPAHVWENRWKDDEDYPIFSIVASIPE